MRREDLGDLTAFIAVAEAQSFTRAAATLGTSQSALSHTLRRLEERVGLRLLARTTRSVALTEAGERLLRVARPAFDDIDQELTALNALTEKPSGSIRLNSSWHAAEMILWPKLRPFLRNHPDVRLELIVEQALTDIVAERFDAGVRLGEQVAKDMIAVRIGPELRMAVLGAPAYFASHPIPKTPHDLTEHNCINLRLATHGGLYAWEFEKDGRALNVRVDGQLTFSNSNMILDAAVDGFGLICVVEDYALHHVKDGRLVRALEDWCPPFSGYHLYYPSRRQLSPAFALLVEALRYRG